MIEFEEESEYSACIKVVGVGGAGGIVVDKMAEWGKDIELLAVNADVAALKSLRLRRKIRIGARLTKGLGCGGNPDTGREAVEQEKKRVGGMLAGADLIFIVAGLGGGTGSGASPVIAEIASETGAITVAVVTKPFLFEGIKKGDVAEAGIGELRKTCDTLICVSNEKLFTQTRTDSFLLDAFDEANRVLLSGVKAISSLVMSPGLISLDFADVRAVLKKSGDAGFGVGIGEGKNRGEKAAESALGSVLLQNANVSAGKNMLVGISGGQDLRQEEVDKISETVLKRVGRQLNVLLGVAIDRELKGKVEVTLVVTGMSPAPEKKPLVVSEESLADLISGQRGYAGHFEDELDIPTFLRKKHKGS